MMSSVALDAVRVRTLWLRRPGPNPRALACAALVAKLLVLIIELMSKRTALEAEYAQSPPEATANCLDRAVFWWINPLLKRGTRVMLALDDLWRTDSALATTRLYDTLGKCIEQPWLVRYSPGASHPLLFATLHATAIPLSQAIIPRILLAACQYSQPLLIYRVTDIVAKGYESSSQSVRLGLIGACGLIYTGTAVSMVLLLASCPASSGRTVGKDKRTYLSAVTNSNFLRLL